jgi:hypothetical protein
MKAQGGHARFPTFKKGALVAIRGEKTLAELGQEFDIRPSQIV